MFLKILQQKESFAENRFAGFSIARSREKIGENDVPLCYLVQNISALLSLPTMIKRQLRELGRKYRKP